MLTICELFRSGSYLALFFAWTPHRNTGKVICLHKPCGKCVGGEGVIEKIDALLEINNESDCG
jgi:hypothetical protein